LLNRDKRSYSIQAVENALTILEAFGEIDGEVRITRLSEMLEIDKSYVFRLLATFEERGYVEKAERTGRYRLGLAAYVTGQKILSRMGLLTKAKPVMERLARACDEAVYLAVLRNREVLMLDMVDTTQMVGTVSFVGNAYPLTKTVAGKVLLAFGTDLTGRAEEDIPSSLQDELVAIRKEGAGLDSECIGAGTACLAVPLFNAQGKVPGSLCVVGPEFRFSNEHCENHLLPALKAAGEIISTRLGSHFGFSKIPGREALPADLTFCGSWQGGRVGSRF
jgi:DNA-binding IclR family transcriptional regulator